MGQYFKREDYKIMNDVYEEARLGYSSIGSGVFPDKKQTKKNGVFYIIIEFTSNEVSRHLPAAKGLRFRTYHEASLWIRLNRFMRTFGNHMGD